MQGWMAPTDIDWFTFLASQPALEEVNFWTPSSHFTFRAQPGTPFLFKLKAPHSAVAGYGLFQRYDRLPEWLAWEAFGVANGAPSFAAMKARLDKIRQRNNMQGGESLDQIGCITLSNPVFLPRDMWTPQPADWPSRNLRPMQYDLSQGEGQRVWEACQRFGLSTPMVAAAREIPDRWGDPVLVRPRLGQAAFRLAVTEAYGRACAATGEHSLPALEAAHIMPFTEDGPHEVANGLLLRSDVHRLFDRGYVSVDSDHRLLVSDRLRDHFQNGKSYFPMRGQPIYVPNVLADRPDPVLLRWHREHRFLG
jgi:putative restriction endonuclease